MSRSTVLRALIGLTLLVPVSFLGRTGDAAGSSGPDQHVIVVLKNQHPELRGRFSLGIRADTLRNEQAPILTELNGANASRVRAYHLINAIATTVSPAEIGRLYANPGVAAVVPDLTLPTTRSSRLDQPVTRSQAASVTAQASYTCPSTPTLEPEGLSLTHTLDVPNSITGAGVKVAFMADGLDINNPDFIRSDSSHAIVDYQDFSGDGTGAATGGTEAFGDAGTIGAQAQQTYNAYSFVVPAHTGTCPIKIRGVSPGADILALKTFGRSLPPESINIEAIQYAVDHGVDVLSQSFGVPEYPAQSTDPLAMAEDAAIADGVTMVASSGDSGPTNANSIVPAADPNVISVGATTQFRWYAQTASDGFSLGNGEWLNNNISGFSSSGFTPLGTRSVDLVAPGDSSWVPCTANSASYNECANFAGNPSNFIHFSGTSEAAPFVAGEAALIIQAYRQTHSGKSPSPGLVKQFITGAADDLGIPSNLQGAGLMDSARAVQAAQSYQDANGTPTPQGATLLSSPSALAATDAPNKTQTFSVNVTNDSAVTETVQPSVRTLGAPFSSSLYTLTLDPTKAPTFTSEYGDNVPYVAKTFSVPSGAQRLLASISYDIVSQPGQLVRLVLLDPQKRFASWSNPYGMNPYGTSGYGRADVRNPAPGMWTAIAWTRHYNGPVHLSVASSKFVAAKLAQQPAPVQLNPGQTAPVTIKINTPTTAGDFNADVILTGTASGHPAITTVLPLYLRSLIPMGLHGGAFSGMLTGGNGRPNPEPTLGYQFDVPAGLHDLELGISLTDSHYNLSGFLVDPHGVPIEAQTTATALDPQTLDPTAFTNTMQFFRRDPEAGRWTFILLIDVTISGAKTALPFTGKIVFNGVHVQAPTLPNSANTSLPAGQPRTVAITITNTGNTTKRFFPDARLPGSKRYHVLSVNDILGDSTHPPTTAETLDQLPVSPATTDLAITSTSPDGPVSLDMQYIGGGLPSGTAGASHVDAVSNFDQGTGLYTATAEYSSPELASGVWGTFISVAGRFGANPGPTTHVHTDAFVTTAPWDTTVNSDTGDAWAILYPGSQTPFAPLTLAPGAQGTIHLTITPSAQTGTVVQGHIFIDTLSLSGGYDTNFYSGDELVALPYEYKVG